MVNQATQLQPGIGERRRLSADRIAGDYAELLAGVGERRRLRRLDNPGADT